MKEPKVLEKFADEVRVFAFDFSKQPEQVPAADIVSALVTIDNPPMSPPLVIEPVQIDGAVVKVRLSGGRGGETALLKCDATTSLGSVMEMWGKLFIVDTSGY